MIDKLERHKNFLNKLKEMNLPMTAEVAQILGFTGDQQSGQGGPPPDMGGIPTSISGGGGGEGAMEGMGGGGETEAGLPEVVPGAQGSNGATGGIAKQPGVQGSPSESHMPVGLPVSR